MQATACPKCGKHMDHVRSIDKHSSRDRWEEWKCPCGYRFAHAAGSKRARLLREKAAGNGPSR